MYTTITRVFRHKKSFADKSSTLINKGKIQNGMQNGAKLALVFC